MKETKVIGMYKCGHSWTKIFRGLSAQERKLAEREFKEKVCPRCEKKEEEIQKPNDL